MILDKFPSIEEFYRTYWGKKPFLVRGMVDKNIFSTFIDADTLAGLSLEEDIKSRIVITKSKDKKWVCHHGPFDKKKFSTLEEKNWSLLVQNVEQYHINTAKLLQSFHFAPRWLMDDIMVSYSTAGGSVGPHTDSYHVFLAQGQGRRKWTISQNPVTNGECVEGLDLKVLKDGFKGIEIEVSIGDVIYIPPNFAHEGITTEESLTFSVGFLGPKISELLAEYGFYLEQNEEENKRYVGQDLDEQSSAFSISPQTKNTIQNNLIDSIQSDSFSKWLAEYFSTPTHDAIENIEFQKNKLSNKSILHHLENGKHFYKPENIKFSITTSTDGNLILAVLGRVIPTSSAHDKFIRWLNKNSNISLKNIDILGNESEIIDLLTQLYNQNILFFKNE